MDSVRNCENCLLSEGPFHHFLDREIGVDVDARGGLVDEHNFLGTQQCARDVEELLLSDAEIVAALRDR